MVQAVIVAGDRGASRSVRGRSKPFVEIAGKPMVVHVLEALLHTPEVAEVFIAGDPIRVEKALAEHGCVDLAAVRSRPIHIVPQRNSLYENVMACFSLAHPIGTPNPSHPILVVPADIPVVVPEEISDFVSEAQKTGADYVIGLSPEQALAPFRPSEDEPGVEMAYFNLREGRLRQNNLHYVCPLQVRNRHYIQDMYEHRYQREWRSMLGLIGRVLRRRSSACVRGPSGPCSCRSPSG